MMLEPDVGPIDDARVHQLIREISLSLEEAKLMEEEKDGQIRHLQQVVMNSMEEKDKEVNHLQQVIMIVQQEGRQLADQVKGMQHELEMTAQAKHELLSAVNELILDERARERERTTAEVITAEATDLQAVRLEELSVLNREADEAREAVRQAEIRRSSAECELLSLRAKLAERDQELIVKSAEALSAIRCFFQSTS